MSPKTRRLELNVPMITRLEGEGALTLNATDGVLESAHLRIYEPPRFFEKFIEGKHYSEVPAIVSRICGICPIAYQMTAIRALENLFEAAIPEEIRNLRRVTQCGEWLQSHALHIFFLAAPDYLGFPSLMAMAGEHPKLVRLGLRLQSLGNDLLALQGGRSVHPVGLCVGGYHNLPDPGDIKALIGRLKQAQADAERLVRWVAALPLPEDSQSFLSVCCSGNGLYPMNEGDIRVSDGSRISPLCFRQHFVEHQQPHSTALFSLYQDQAYLVGPLARINAHFSRLPEPLQQLCHELGWVFPSDNMYHSIRARALECCYAIAEALRLLQSYQPPETSAVTFEPRAGWCAHVTEAPRGLIYHHYEVNNQGEVVSGCIIPPTSQNQARIAQDLIASVTRFGLERPDQEIRFFCERLIRNYDPCISCSVHFLKLNLVR